MIVIFVAENSYITKEECVTLAMERIAMDWAVAHMATAVVADFMAPAVLPCTTIRTERTECARIIPHAPKIYRTIAISA